MMFVLDDFRFAARNLRKNRGFAAAALFTFALGIGATTAIFSVVHGVLLRPLPYPDSEAIVQVRQVAENGGSQRNVSFPNFVDLREQSRTFTAMGAWSDVTVPVMAAGEPARVRTALVTSGFFEVLGIEAALGRRLAITETGQIEPGAAVVGHEYWQRHLGGDRNLAEQVLRFGGQPYRVVGVMPPGFSFPAGVELWLPSGATLANQSRTAHNFEVIARLRDGETLAEARSELGLVARRLKALYGDDTWMSGATAVPLREELVGAARPVFLVLFGASGVLLLIAAANLGNLLFAHMASRRQELATRIALGAGRLRITSQLLAETLLLSLIGGGLGVLAAAFGVPLLLSLEPGGLPRLDEIKVDRAVLAFALGVSVMTAVATGLLPGLRTMRTDVRASLADRHGTPSGGAGSGRVRQVLAAAQVALALVLLTGGALLAQSFLRLLAVDPGYRTDGPAVVMELWLPQAADDASAVRAGRFHQELLQRVRAIPGVTAAGGVNAFPLSGGGANGTFLVLDSPDEFGNVSGSTADPELFARLEAMMRNPDRIGFAEFRVASEGYFRAMGIPLLRGRLFGEHDAPGAPPVAVVSDSLAQARWPGEDPLGKVIQYGNMDGDLRPFTVVGVVGDIREESLEAEPEPTFYGLSRQRPRSTLHYYVIMRGTSAPAAMIASARAIARDLDPAVAVEIRTLDEVFASAVAGRRFTLVLLGVFGAASLLLAVTGIYALTAWLASRRMKEVGVRVALGARSRDVLRLFLGQSAMLAGAGVVAGLLAATGLLRLLDSLLYDTSTLDPAIFAAVSLLLVAVAVLASYLPARRASRADPLTTLRSE